jgi:anti-anti-sigma factor
MEHELHDEDGITVLAPRGPIDVGHALDLRNLIAGTIESPGARLLVDLTHVTLIDSSGVGIFVTAHRNAEGTGAEFALANPVGPVGRVFEMTRTNKLLRIYPSLQEGLAALRGA